MRGAGDERNAGLRRKIFQSASAHTNRKRVRRDEKRGAKEF
jgi:hypothetical protein